MPETAVDKNDFFTLCEREIGFAWQIAAMKPKSVSQVVDCLAHANFWLHILATDSSHICAAALNGKLVSHLPNFLQSQL
jgi:hypothetical protein